MEPRRDLPGTGEEGEGEFLGLADDYIVGRQFRHVPIASRLSCANICMCLSD